MIRPYSNNQTGPIYDVNCILKVYKDGLILRETGTKLHIYEDVHTHGAHKSITKFAKFSKQKHIITHHQGLLGECDNDNTKKYVCALCFYVFVDHGSQGLRKRVRPHREIFTITQL